MKAVILAGGLGTRLQPYTFFVPKPMLPLGNKPVLEHIVDWLRNNGIQDIVICVSYLKRNIEDYFEDGRAFGVRIQYAESDKPLATAGQLKTAEKFLDEPFVLAYGDSVYEFNLSDMIEDHRKSNSFVTMALMQHKIKVPYGIIDIDKDNKILAWREKPEISPGLINIGCYAMEPEFLKMIPNEGTYGMDNALLAAMDQKKTVRGFQITGSFIDIGDKQSFEETSKKFIEKMGKI